MSIDKINSKKFPQTIDWKSFFDMRIFRYSFLKQLKSILTYVCFGFAIFSSIASSFSIYSGLPNLYFFYLTPFGFFIIFIPHKSLQIFRDEMDDGTLLIFSSMPYSRLKLVIQKWLSLQAICLMFVLIIILTKPFILLIFKGFSPHAWEATKYLYENSLLFIVYVVTFHIIFSTFTVLISLYFGVKATMAFSILFFYLLAFTVLICLLFLKIDLTIFTSSIFLYLVYPLISLFLMALVIFVVCKKDFV